MDSVTRRRVGLADELRGAAILLVVAYHVLYDMHYLYGIQVPWLFTPAGDCLRDGIAGTMIYVSGVSCRYARSNLKRGLRILGLGMLITLLTCAVMPEQRILFGILHFLGTAMILYHFAGKTLEKLHPAAGAGMGVLLFAFTRWIETGVVGFGPFTLRLPAVLYRTNWLFPLGFYGPGFFSADYYALIPWGFLFWSGATLAGYTLSNRAPEYVYGVRLPWLAAAGRHSLLIYLAHQPLSLLVLTLLF